MRDEAIEFLKKVIALPSPSGFEQPVARHYRAFAERHAHRVTTDIMGNVIAQLNPEAATRIFYAGHMDEIGFIIHHIDAAGFLYFNTIGGTDVATEIGQRVKVHGRETVPGTIGRKPIQLLDAADQKQTPTLTDLWIDIGATSQEEAKKVVAVGDPVTIDSDFSMLQGGYAIGRAFDNKVGLTIGAELLYCLAREGGLHPQVGIDILGTVQEEIGSRGATTAAFNLNPPVSLTIDMGVAMDFPRARVYEHGALDCGKGPAISQGANTNPIVFQMLMDAALEKNIPHQIQAVGKTSPTDGRNIQDNRGGCATDILSVPLRYMHTPSEIVCLDDIQATVDLACEFCRRVRPDTDFTPW